jgi:hypothetical protein
MVRSSPSLTPRGCTAWPPVKSFRQNRFFRFHGHFVSGITRTVFYRHEIPVTNLPLSQLTSFQPSFRGSFQPEPAGEEEGASGGEGAFDPKEHEEAFGQHGLMDNMLGLVSKKNRAQAKGESKERRKMSELPRHLAGQVCTTCAHAR